MFATPALPALFSKTIAAIDPPIRRAIIIPAGIQLFRGTDVIVFNPLSNCNNDGTQNNEETGVDCGGGGCPVCPCMFLSMLLSGVVIIIIIIIFL